AVAGLTASRGSGRTLFASSRCAPSLRLPVPLLPPCLAVSLQIFGVFLSSFYGNRNPSACRCFRCDAYRQSAPSWRGPGSSHQAGKERSDLASVCRLSTSLGFFLRFVKQFSHPLPPRRNH